MKIVWATDGSAGSEGALPYLNGLFNRRENTIVVTAVAPAPLVSAARPDPAMLLWHLVPGYRERVSNEVTELVVRQVGLLAKSRATVTSAVRLGSAPTEIILLARDEGADLVITGARGHTPAAEILLGSVSQQVATNAECAVLVVRGRKRPAKVLLAYDASPDAQAGLELLASLVPPKGAEVIVTAVVEPAMPALDAPPDWVPDSAQELERWRRTSARRNAQAAVRKLRASGWSASSHIGTGHPGDSVLRTARERGVDLVVMGARGIHSSDAEARGMGGIPRQVIERALCSVLISRDRLRESPSA
ncbi:MAG: universal stress protein [Dehalococcoidia bacterium]